MGEQQPLLNSSAASKGGSAGTGYLPWVRSSSALTQMCMHSFALCAQRLFQACSLSVCVLI